MRRRMLELMSVAVLIGVVSLAMATARAQTQTTSTPRGQAIKTSWGEPDLQGIWGIEFQVPLQRPTKFKDKEFLTGRERDRTRPRRRVRLQSLPPAPPYGQAHFADCGPAGRAAPSLHTGGAGE